jgi:uncharacterized protein
MVFATMYEAEIAEVWAMLDRPYLQEVTHKGPRAIFACISGAHLYGFASPDSDVDLRGAYMLPASELLGLHPADETMTLVDQSRIDLDWVGHDIRKFARLMTQHNGYVLELLYSPLTVVDSPAFFELRELGKGCITRPTVRHYLGFAKGRRKRIHEPEPTVKHLLYAYRVLLSGIHLMQAGEVVANINVLNDTLSAQLPSARSAIDELVRRKREGQEKMKLVDGEIAAHDLILGELEVALHAAHEKSSLPEEPTTVRELNDLVIRLRLSP